MKQTLLRKYRHPQKGIDRSLPSMGMPLCVVHFRPGIRCLSPIQSKSSSSSSASWTFVAMMVKSGGVSGMMFKSSFGLFARLLRGVAVTGVEGLLECPLVVERCSFGDRFGETLGGRDTLKTFDILSQCFNNSVLFLCSSSSNSYKCHSRGMELIVGPGGGHCLLSTLRSPPPQYGCSPVPC